MSTGQGPEQGQTKGLTRRQYNALLFAGGVLLVSLGATTTKLLEILDQSNIDIEDLGNGKESILGRIEEAQERNRRQQLIREILHQDLGTWSLATGELTSSYPSYGLNTVTWPIPQSYTLEAFPDNDPSTLGYWTDAYSANWGTSINYVAEPIDMRSVQKDIREIVNQAFQNQNSLFYGVDLYTATIESKISLHHGFDHEGRITNNYSRTMTITDTNWIINIEQHFDSSGKPLALEVTRQIIAADESIVQISSMSAKNRQVEESINEVNRLISLLRRPDIDWFMTSQQVKNLQDSLPPGAVEVEASIVEQIWSTYESVKVSKEAPVRAEIRAENDRNTVASVEKLEGLLTIVNDNKIRSLKISVPVSVMEGIRDKGLDEILQRLLLQEPGNDITISMGQYALINFAGRFDEKRISVTIPSDGINSKKTIILTLVEHKGKKYYSLKCVSDDPIRQIQNSREHETILPLMEAIFEKWEQ